MELLRSARDDSNRAPIEADFSTLGRRRIEKNRQNLGIKVQGKTLIMKRLGEGMTMCTKSGCHECMSAESPNYLLVKLLSGIF